MNRHISAGIFSTSLEPSSYVHSIIKGVTDACSVKDSKCGTQRLQKEGLEFNLSQYDEIDNYCKYK